MAAALELHSFPSLSLVCGKWNEFRSQINDSFFVLDISVSYRTTNKMADAMNIVALKNYLRSSSICIYSLAVLEARIIGDNDSLSLKG